APLEPVGVSGIWAGFVEAVQPGAKYKYHIISRHHGYRVEKADPFGFLHEVPPRTASIVTTLEYEWGDSRWMEQRRDRNALGAPISHLRGASRILDAAGRAGALPQLPRGCAPPRRVCD